VCLYQALCWCKEQIEAGRRDVIELKSHMMTIIEQQGGQIDYIEIVDAEILEPCQEFNGRILIALAVYFGNTRLIDNLLLDLK